MNSYPSSFNARNKSPKEIVDNFIVPKEFGTIAAHCNLVLVGPRGIGKTTIMKALTPSGLFFLGKKPEFKSLFDEVDFNYVPIYIPAETLWKGNAHIINSLANGDGFKESVLNGLFVDHCLHELIGSVEDSIRVSAQFDDGDVPYWALKVSKAQESNICSMCSRLWKLHRVETSFLGVKLALIERANQYRSKINSFEHQNDHSMLVAEHLDVLLMFKGFFDIVDDVLERAIKWSINFDEMEIAPKRVLYKLYENLRSFDHRAVLKFSLFPFVDFYDFEARNSSATSPVEGQDFVAVNLTNRFANPEHGFSRDLIELQCNQRKVNVSGFSNYLNSSSAIIKETREYKEARTERNFETLFENAKKDEVDYSFLKFMEGQGVNSSEDVSGISGNKRAQYIRKVSPILEVRSYYLAEKVKVEGGIRRRSVKGYGYYHGFDQILSLTEGNPRAINFYVNELLDGYLSGEKSSTVQNKAISRNVDRFRALIATQVVPSSGYKTEMRNPLEVVDRLGASVSNSLFDVQFKPEPQLSFEFKSLDPATKEVLGIAINAGALVVDQRREGLHLLFEIVDCRARISHRLAPFYPLPLITGQSRIITNIPNGNKTIKREPDLLNWGNLDD